MSQRFMSWMTPSSSQDSNVRPAATLTLRATIASNFSAAASAGVGVDVFVEVGPPAARILDRAAVLPADIIVPTSTRLARPATTRIRNGKPYVQILDVAKEEDSDLIVIGVHGRNPFDMMLFGSTANQTVRRATCPVLTLRHA